MENLPKGFQNVAEDENSQGGVKNAYYTIMVDYSKTNRTIQDNVHKDNYFNYGHIGTFDIYKTPSYEFSDFDGNGVLDLVQTGVNDDSIQFTPSASNADMAAITSQYFYLYDQIAGNYENTTKLLDGVVLPNGRRPTSVYGLWRNITHGYNLSSNQDNSQFTSLKVSLADIGDHVISLGLNMNSELTDILWCHPSSLRLL